MGKNSWTSHLQGLSSCPTPSVQLYPLLPFSSVNTGTSCTGSGFTPQNPQPQVPSLPEMDPDVGICLPCFPALLGLEQAWFQWEAGVRSRVVRPLKVYIQP